MSTGNLFQGMARGSVGDVTFTRINGQQVARVRNRKPKNPRTNKQLYQRAIMATVMRAYSAGRAIFDHSFEGVKFGQDNQRKFLALNTRKLRDLAAADLANSVAGTASRILFAGPGVVAPTPSPYIISEGTLPVGLMTPRVLAASSAEWGGYDLTQPAIVERETQAQYAQRCIDMGAVHPDDIYTICLFMVDTTKLPLFELRGVNPAASKQFPCEFGFIRLRFNSLMLTSETVATATNSRLIANVEEDQQPVGDNGGLFTYDYVTDNAYQFYDDCVKGKYTSGSVNGAITAERADGSMKAFIGIIRSRTNTDLRSTASMQYSLSANNTNTPAGITAPYMLQAWQQGTAEVGTSDRILEGGQS